MTAAPAAVGCAAFVVGIVSGAVLVPDQPLVGLVAVVAAVATLAVALVARPLLVPLSIAAALLGLARAELGAADPSLARRAATLAGSLVVVRALVAEDPHPSSGGFEVLVTPRRIVSGGGPLAPAGNILVRVRGPGEVQAGDEVSLTGRLRLPVDRPGFDRRAYLAQRQAFLEVQTPRLDVLARPGGAAGLGGIPAQLRERYRGAVAQLLPVPYSGLLVGVVLGVRSGIPAQLQKDLVATGLVHLLVLSGLKVAVFTRLAGAALRPMLGRLAILPLLALVTLYALAGGSTPAAVRAAAMGGLVALALVLGRPSHVWTSLAAVGAAMVAWKPELISDVGYQLSFVGTAAIILLTPPIERRLSWMPGLFREPFAVTTAAQLGTIPLMATDFHLISPSAPLANALVLPLLPALVLGGLLLPPLAILPELGRLLALPLVGMLEYLVQVASVLARIPVAAFPAPDFSGPPGAAYYLGAGAILAGSRVRGRRRLALVAAGVLLPVLVGGAELAAWGRGQPSVAVLSVGDGEAVLVTGLGGHVLIDGGADPGRLASEIGQRLPPWERRLAGLILTGTSNREVAGLAALDRPGIELVLPGEPLQGYAWRRSILSSLAAGGRVRSLHAGDSFQLAGLRFEALAPEPGATQLALRLSRPGGRSFCDLGELDQEGQEQAAARLAAAGGGCDTLLLPGGGRSAPAPTLLSVARPQRLIASVGSGRIDRTLPASRVERTDQEGTVVVPL